MFKTIRVLVAEKDSLIRAGIHATLTAEEDLRVVGEAVNGDEVQQLGRELDPDVLVLSLNMRGPSLAEIVAYVGRHCL